MTGPSGGVTATERLLAEFCERSFLKLWSYPNPHKDDGHELCDLLAVFGDTVFIFFDREKGNTEFLGIARRMLLGSLIAARKHPRHATKEKAEVQVEGSSERSLASNSVIAR